MTMIIVFNPDSKTIGCSIINMINENLERFQEAEKISFLKTRLMGIGRYFSDNEDNIFW